MAEHKLTGLSIAVFDRYRIVAVRSFGSKAVGTDAPIRDTTAFSTASISKPVTALLALMLEAEGRLDLDAPVATYLRRWRLPDSPYPASARITLRQLLTHRAGTSQHGFADYYEGDRIPTLVDSLEGRIPRYDKPIAFLFAPGTDWKYSGGGYVIAQMAIEDRTGRPLAALAAEKVFGPLGMRHTSMIQPGEPGFARDVALVHDEQGRIIRTGLPITPQVSASGMWSTPTDLARFAIAIQRALMGSHDGPVTPAMARALTGIVSLKPVGGMAMPFFRGFGLGRTDWFRHDGSNTGVNSDLFGAMTGGYGFVLMGNGDDANTGPVFAMLRGAIIDTMRWGATPPPDRPIDPALARALPGTYKGLLYDLGLDYRIEEQDGALWIASDFFTQFLGRDASRMRHLGGGTFAIDDYPNRLRFHRGADGRIVQVTIDRPGSGADPVTRPVERVGAP
ncbi:serine hydrolase [Sphingomonas sp. ST-64]|uniref:Serine hydrolase n=2 Tax=Sphingomonas plantiphila TaxID=3163295 RepID=A0ABW8YIT1_9SPHN